MALVELHAISKTYYLGEARIAALSQVSLSIEPGEFVAVWGPSGSGKSTLCNLIGLLDQPTGGQVILDGLDATRLSDDYKSDLRNHRFGFVFQQFNLLPVLSALENVMLPLQIRGVIGARARDAAMSRLDDMGLASHIHHRPHKLSGGQQQRVAIARALVTEPRLVLADEPTANLDTENAKLIIDLMHEINQRDGTTFLFSTHDERLLSRVGRRIHLRDGRLDADETGSIQ